MCVGRVIITGAKANPKPTNPKPTNPKPSQCTLNAGLEWRGGALVRGTMTPLDDF